MPKSVSAGIRRQFERSWNGLFLYLRHIQKTGFVSCCYGHYSPSSSLDFLYFLPTSLSSSAFFRACTSAKTSENPEGSITGGNGAGFASALICSNVITCPSLFTSKSGSKRKV